MKKWKVKQETANLLQNIYTPERYLEKFLSNIQVAKQKECGIWLDHGTIMSELKITKTSSIMWETSDSTDIEKAREVATDKMQEMPFIQNSSRRYDGMRHETENNMLKGREEYPTNVTSS